MFCCRGDVPSLPKSHFHERKVSLFALKAQKFPIVTFVAGPLNRNVHQISQMCVSNSQLHIATRNQPFVQMWNGSKKRFRSCFNLHTHLDRSVH